MPYNFYVITPWYKCIFRLTVSTYELSTCTSHRNLQTNQGREWTVHTTSSPKRILICWRCV